MPCYVIPALLMRDTAETLEYESKTVGEKRKAMVHLPLGYGKEKDAKLPVLYLPHGIRDAEDDWVKKGVAVCDLGMWDHRP